MNRTISILLAIIIVLAIFLAIFIAVIVYIEANLDKGKVFAVGVLDHYEYVPGLGGNRATVIYFTNGTSFVMQGDHYSVSYPPGTWIQIIGAGGERYRIMPINSQ